MDVTVTIYVFEDYSFATKCVKFILGEKISHTVIGIRYNRKGRVHEEIYEATLPCVLLRRREYCTIFTKCKKYYQFSVPIESRQQLDSLKDLLLSRVGEPYSLYAGFMNLLSRMLPNKLTSKIFKKSGVEYKFNCFSYVVKSIRSIYPEFGGKDHASEFYGRHFYKICEKQFKEPEVVQEE